MSVDEPKIREYPNLKGLVVKECAFDNTYAIDICAVGRSSTESPYLQYRADILHQTLAGSPNLQKSKVKMH
jgi:hypothetical protein